VAVAVGVGLGVAVAVGVGVGVCVAVGVAVAVGDGVKVAVGGAGVCVADTGGVVGLTFPQPTANTESTIAETIVIERADICDGLEPNWRECNTDSPSSNVVS
jgi:hypothetical protein